jgi:hypothetical protein
MERFLFVSGHNRSCFLGRQACGSWKYSFPAPRLFYKKTCDHPKLLGFLNGGYLTNPLAGWRYKNQMLDTEAEDGG